MDFSDDNKVMISKLICDLVTKILNKVKWADRRRISLQIIISLFFLFSLPGCSGCTYFFLKIESLDKESSGGQDPNSSDLPSQTNPANSIAKNISVSSSATIVNRGLSDTTEVNFITVSLDGPASEDFSVKITNESQFAKLSDFEFSEGSLGSTISSGTISSLIINSTGTFLQFLKGESQKKISLIVKSNSGPADFDKIVKLKLNDNSSPLILSGTSTVLLEFTIHDPKALVINVDNYLVNAGSFWNEYGLFGYKSSFLPAGLELSSRLKFDFTEFNLTGGTIIPCPTAFLSDCLNAGQLKKVIVSNESECAGLELSDSENVFYWKCSDRTPPVLFYSSGFNKGKGLKNLVLTTGTGWKPMQVHLKKNNNLIQSSAISTWWLNTVSPLDSSNINSNITDLRKDLSGFRSIYVVTGTIYSRGINLVDDGIALVAITGATLTGTSTLSSTDCDLLYAGNQNCLIKPDSTKKDFCIEGQFNSNNNGLYTIGYDGGDQGSITIYNSVFNLTR